MRLTMEPENPPGQLWYLYEQFVPFPLLSDLRNERRNGSWFRWEEEEHRVPGQTSVLLSAMTRLLSNDHTL